VEQKSRQDNFLINFIGNRNSTTLLS